MPSLSTSDTFENESCLNRCNGLDVPVGMSDADCYRVAELLLAVANAITQSSMPVFLTMKTRAEKRRTSMKTARVNVTMVTSRNATP